MPERCVYELSPWLPSPGVAGINSTRAAPINYIERITAMYSDLGYGTYRWVHSDDDPAWTPLTKPIAESRLGVIATGGIYRVGQTAFHYKDDTSYRAIPTDTSTAELRATHFAYDLTDARSDINCVLPVDALQTLSDEGRIGDLGPNHYTLMGGIYSTRRVEHELAPALLNRCRADELDVVLLVPV